MTENMYAKEARIIEAWLSLRIKEARKLATWLIKAADLIEQESEGG